MEKTTFLAIVDQIPLRVSVWKITDGPPALVYLNPAALAAARFDAPAPQRTVDELFAETLEESCARRLEEALREAVDGSGPVRFREVDFVKPHTSPWYTIDLLPLGEGRVAILDEGEAHAVRRIHEAIVANSDDAILSKTLDGTVNSWNRAAEQMYGYSAGEMIGRSIKTLVPEGEGAEVDDFHTRLAQGEKIARHETRRVRKDGEVLDVSLTISPLRDVAGKIRGASTIARDITLVKRLQAQVQQQENLERLGALASGIAHDFSNLLVGVIGNADLLRTRLAQDDPAQRQLEMITKLSVRASELCKQMLNYSGEQLSLSEPVDVSAVCRDVAELFGDGLPPEVDLRLELDDGLPTVSLNPTELRQLLLNLLHNAHTALAGCAEKQLVLATSVVESHTLDPSSMAVRPVQLGPPLVAVEVRDTGCGMSAEVQARMFDPYFTTREQGHGLGLATVLGVVRNHFGGVTVESAPGRGTTVRVLFPVFVAPDEDEQALDWSRAKRVVMVVDDERTVRDVARDILFGAGIQVVTVSGGAQAVSTFRRHTDQIALVILDLTMPEMDGRDTLRALRQVRKDVRVVISSGYDMETALADLEDEPTGFLPKPYRASTLIFSVFQALRS